MTAPGHEARAVSEAAVRNAFRRHLLASMDEVLSTVDEFWVPRSHERADLVAFGDRMHGFEIKTSRDDLRRLPRQVSAYGCVFERCTAVVARRHVQRVAELLPDWWGLTTIALNGSIRFEEQRPAGTNPRVDPETLVRLLWRDEAMSAVAGLGLAPPERASRSWLWRELLRALDPGELSEVVLRAHLARDPMTARIPTRRFRPDLYGPATRS